MTDTTITPATPTTPAPRPRTYQVDAVQLELTQGTTDKVYRLFEMFDCKTGGYVLVRQWGRRGAKGQVKVQTVNYRYESAYEEFRGLESQKRWDKGYEEIARATFEISFDVVANKMPPAELFAGLLEAFSDTWFENSMLTAASNPVYYDDEAELWVRIPAARTTAKTRPAAGKLLDGFASAIVHEDRVGDVAVARIPAGTASAVVELFSGVEFTATAASDTLRTVQGALALMHRGARRSGFDEAMRIGRRIES